MTSSNPSTVPPPPPPPPPSPTPLQRDLIEQLKEIRERYSINGVILTLYDTPLEYMSAYQLRRAIDNEFLQLLAEASYVEQMERTWLISNAVISSNLLLQSFQLHTNEIRSRNVIYCERNELMRMRQNQFVLLAKRVVIEAQNTVNIHFWNTKASKIQSLYRGHAVRKRMRTTDNVRASSHGLTMMMIISDQQTQQQQAISDEPEPMWYHIHQAQAQPCADVSWHHLVPHLQLQVATAKVPKRVRLLDNATTHIVSF
jgi:hypothetical protein